jgi:hypothetical protein
VGAAVSRQIGGRLKTPRLGVNQGFAHYVSGDAGAAARTSYSRTPMPLGEDPHDLRRAARRAPTAPRQPTGAHGSDDEKHPAPLFAIDQDAVTLLAAPSAIQVKHGKGGPSHLLRIRPRPACPAGTLPLFL